jgi:hypothetical protein
MDAQGDAAHHTLVQLGYDEAPQIAFDVFRRPIANQAEASEPGQQAGDRLHVARAGGPQLGLRRCGCLLVARLGRRVPFAPALTQVCSSAVSTTAPRITLERDGSAANGRHSKGREVATDPPREPALRQRIEPV